MPVSQKKKIIQIDALLLTYAVLPNLTQHSAIPASSASRPSGLSPGIEYRVPENVL